MAKISGWHGSWRFQLIESKGQIPGYTELLALNNFDEINGLDRPEHALEKSTP